MFTRRNFGRTAMLAASATLLAITAFASGGAKAADFSGKRITIIVPFSEGGGTDSYSRFMAPYFEKYLPGHPKIIVLNKPGGGGLTGVNYYADRATKDGTHHVLHPQQSRHPERKDAEGQDQEAGQLSAGEAELRRQDADLGRPGASRCAQPARR